MLLGLALPRVLCCWAKDSDLDVHHSPFSFHSVNQSGPDTERFTFHLLLAKLCPGVGGVPSTAKGQQLISVSHLFICEQEFHEQEFHQKEA